MLKTMEQIRQTMDIYPTTIEINSIDKSAIEDWFDTRYVCDNENFVRYFRRVLVRDYGRYRELLRIEPHVSKYDWLVQQYNESQTFTKTNDTTIANGETTNKQTGNTTNETANEHRENVGEQASNSTTENITRQDVENVIRDTVDGGTDILENAGTSESKSTTKNTAGGKDKAESESHDNTKTLSRENPMSISYAGGASIDGNTNKGALDWSYPTSQGETDNRSNSENITTYGRTDNSVVENEGQTDDTSTTRYGKTTNDTATTTDNGTENRLVTGTNGITRESSTNDKTAVTTDTESTSTSTTGNASNTQGQQLVQHIDTGRGVDPATLLENAKSFIMNSSAFEWLYKRLDVCFMSVYNDYADEYI